MEGEKWCNCYQCWCDEAEFIIEYSDCCDFDCDNCHHCETSAYDCVTLVYEGSWDK